MQALNTNLQINFADSYNVFLMWVSNFFHNYKISVV